MKDLTDIPKRFHPLFLTDWNAGNESKMNPLQREELSILFLEYNKWDVLRMIDDKKIIEETIVGFVKD
jgi:hypothetical protein